MRIINAKVYGADLKFHEGEILIRNGRFADPLAADEEAEEIIDAGGAYALPGFIDLHFHGCLGYDFCDGTREAVSEIAKYEASVGVTAICPATMTLSVEELESVLKNAADYRKDPEADGADLVGINMEGPFISQVKKGAQNGAYIIPCSAEIAGRFIDASEGLVKYIGLAPEDNPDFEAFITAVKDRARISLAHTNADYSTAKAAFDAGASHAVHLFNAMPAFTHREPGVVGAVSDSPHVYAEIIADGVHIHPSMVRAAFKMNTPERMILISDSLRAAGMPDGEYVLGGLAITKQGRYCRLVEGGNLAGSVSPLPDCVRTVVRDMEIPLETAIACGTINPAKSLGIDAEYGSIEIGKKGNVVLWNEDMSQKAVIKDGRVIA